MFSRLKAAFWGHPSLDSPGRSAGLHPAVYGILAQLDNHPRPHALASCAACHHSVTNAHTHAQLESRRQISQVQRSALKTKTVVGAWYWISRFMIKHLVTDLPSVWHTIQRKNITVAGLGNRMHRATIKPFAASRPPLDTRNGAVIPGARRPVQRARLGLAGRCEAAPTKFSELSNLQH